MNRFSESAADYATGHALHMARVHGDDPTYSAAVNTCENCNQSCETLYPVFKLESNEVEFFACAICKEEAEVEAAKDAALVAKRPARMQGELDFTREVA